MTGLSLRRWGNVLMLALAAMILTGTPAHAQIQTIDPNEAIDADLGTPPKAESPPKLETSANPAMDSSVAEPATDVPATSVPSPAADSATYQQDDLIGAAEGVFGKGAEGLARLIEDVLKKQGQPNGYIVGREGGGALLVGLRYGSGTLHHKVEGEMPVYWTGP